VIRAIGRTERRVVLALLVTAVVPLLTAMWLAKGAIDGISRTAFQPEFSEHLERSLGVYADLVRAMKRAMRAETTALAADSALRTAAHQADGEALRRALARAFVGRPSLRALSITSADGEKLAERRADKPIDPARERAFTVRQALGQGEAAPTLVATFGADKTRLQEMDAAQQFAQAYQALAKRQRSDWLEQPYLETFALLLGLTVLLAAGVGVAVVRPVIRRINQLAAATEPVARGDLSVRVDARGRDEIAALARSFNQMLEALDRSRARIEFLKRIGEWQQMARRLAHEIKNPLTPIQLAVEECHRRYSGRDERYRELLATTLDIVVEEVASLRRLVVEFAAFARLPQASLSKAEICAFVREQEARLRPTVEDAASSGPPGETREVREVRFAVQLPDEPLPVALDRTLLYRVLSNLVANAAQATARSSGDGSGQVRLSVSSTLEDCLIDIDDDGPGVEPEVRPRVFDPYVTTKADGTGLGLTIVKKVVIDHGGHIEVGVSPLGGARFRMRLPLWGTTAAEAALAQSARAPVSA